MKKILFSIMIAALLSGMTAVAQKLVIGERAPEMKIKEWLSDKPVDDNKARLIEFFHSSSKQCGAHLESLNNLAEKYSSKLTVIIITKESVEKVGPMLNAENSKYYVALDDAGKTFGSFAVQFVPFSVLVDGKGRVKWFGNSTSLYEDTISKNIK